MAATPILEWPPSFLARPHPGVVLVFESTAQLVRSDQTCCDVCEKPPCVQCSHLGLRIGSFGGGIGLDSAGFAGASCLQGRECSSSPTSGTVFPQVKGLFPLWLLTKPPKVLTAAYRLLCGQHSQTHQKGRYSVLHGVLAGPEEPRAAGPDGCHPRRSGDPQEAFRHFGDQRTGTLGRVALSPRRAAQPVAQFRRA
jgi:hypothetical protein